MLSNQLTNNKASNRKVSFPIIGMHCASCAKLIERKLNKTPGVISSSVNYANEIASIKVKIMLKIEICPRRLRMRDIRLEQTLRKKNRKNLKI